MLPTKRLERSYLRPFPRFSKLFMSLLSREFQNQEVPALKTFLTDQVCYNHRLFVLYETYEYSSKGIKFTVLNAMVVSIVLNVKPTSLN